MYAVQAILKVDTEIAQKDHFWCETRCIALRLP
jgi:hypothetical protein